MYSSSYTCTPLQQKSISFIITFLYYQANGKLWIRHSEPSHNHAAPGSDWIVATSPWGGHFLLKVFPPRHCLISQETIWTLKLGFLSNIARCVPSSIKCFDVTVVVNWWCINKTQLNYVALSFIKLAFLYSLFSSMQHTHGCTERNLTCTLALHAWSLHKRMFGCAHITCHHL